MKQKKGVFGFAFLPIAIVVTAIILIAVFIFVSAFTSLESEDRKTQQTLLDTTITTRIIVQYELSNNRYVSDLIIENVGVEDFNTIPEETIENLMNDLADVLAEFNINQPVNWVVMINDEVYVINFESPRAINNEEGRIINRAVAANYESFPPGILLPNPKGPNIEVLISQKNVLDEILDDGEILTLRRRRFI